MDWLNGLLGGAPQQPQQPGAAPQYDPYVMKQAEAYGADPGAVDRLMAERRAAILGNVGSSLLAAAQGGPIGQRGRILSGLGEAASAGPNLTTGLMNTAQAKLYAESIKDRQSERALKDEARKGVAGLTGLSPEEALAARLDPTGFMQKRAEEARLARDPVRKLELAKRQLEIGSIEEQKKAVDEFIKTLPPDQQALARINPGAYMKEAIDKNAADKNFDRLVASGVDTKTAARIASGAIVKQFDPATGRTYLFDMTTGQPYGGTGPDGKLTSIPRDPSTIETVMPKGIAFANAFGGQGWLANKANAAAGVFGGLAAPDINRAVDALDNLQVRTQIDLASAVSGRPSNFLIETFKKEALTAGNLWTGGAAAKQSVERIRANLKRGLSNERAALANVANPTKRQEALETIRFLEDLDADYAFIERNWDAPEGSRGGQPAPGAGAGTPAAPGAPAAPGRPRTLSVEPIR